MMRAIQIMLGVLTVLLLAIVVVISQVDWEKYRPELAMQISDAVGADVRVSGPLAITLFPYPKLSASDVQLSAPGLDIHAPRIQLAAKLWPLFQGRVILSHANINEPRISVAPEEWQSGGNAAGGMANAHIQLEDVEIEGGTLEIHRGDAVQRATDIDLKLRAPDWHGPYWAEGDFVWNNQDWELESQIGVKSQAGTRPARFMLQEEDSGIALRWQGAVQPVPLALRGDGVWEDAAKGFALQSPLNLTGRVLSIPQAGVIANGKMVGTANGNFVLGKNTWQDFRAEITGAPAGVLHALPLQAAFPCAAPWTAAGDIRITLLNNQIYFLNFQSTAMNALYQRGQWRMWGPDAAAWLANAQITELKTENVPDDFRSPYDVRFVKIGDSYRITQIRLGKIFASGKINNKALALTLARLPAESFGAISEWAGAFHALTLPSTEISVKDINAAPLFTGSADLVFSSNNKKNNDTAFSIQSPAFDIKGIAENGTKFSAELHCKDAGALGDFFLRLRLPCADASITGNADSWQLTPESGPNPDSGWRAAIHWGNHQWQFFRNFAEGKFSASGKLGQPDWRAELTGMNLPDLLRILTPTAPQLEEARGDITAHLRAGAEKIEGDITVSHAHLPGLNLMVAEPAQSGKINSITAKINWQGDVLELQQIKTNGPDGTGHGSVNLQSQMWHMEWTDVHGNRVELDGPVATAAAMREHALPHQQGARPEND